MKRSAARFHRMPSTGPHRQSWEEIWFQLSSFEARKIVIYTILVDIIFGAVNWAVLQGNPLEAAAYAGGFGLGVLFGGWLLAAILAVPGWLIRGQYNIKPLFIGIIIATFLSSFVSDMLLPLSFEPNFGFVWKSLAYSLLLASTLCSVFILLFTTFPHRWGRGLTIATLILAVVVAFGWTQNQAFKNRQTYLQSVFANNRVGVARILAGKTVPPSQVAMDLLTFEEEAESSRK